MGLFCLFKGSGVYPALKTSPCRYAGSAEEGGFVIAGHNYNCHFGRLNLLKAGDEILFSDASGKLYYYSVYETETLKPSAAEEMKSENWDLTLFTCTYSGTSRTAVRCKAADKQNNQ
ncbi:MAG: sortase [Clostridiales bacterium]|nr:sortase [Clostridiales bacterium]